MSQAIQLDSAKMADLEPTEHSGLKRYRISPFDVPDAIEIIADVERHEIRSIRFIYPGKEPIAARLELPRANLADDLHIQVGSGGLSGRILEMTFGVPIAEHDLSTVSNRLKQIAAETRAIATRFNYRMIAGILDAWPEIISPQLESRSSAKG